MPGGPAAVHATAQLHACGDPAGKSGRVDADSDQGGRSIAVLQGRSLAEWRQSQCRRPDRAPRSGLQWQRRAFPADDRRGRQRRLPGIRVPVVLRVRSGPVSGVGSHNSGTVRVMMGLPHDLFKIVRALSTGGALDQSKRVAMGRSIEDTPLRPTARFLDRFASALQDKKDANDALHLIEPLRVQVVGHLDVLMVLPGDLEGEARGREPYEPQPEVARIGVVIVGLDVADASVTVLELPLNDKIGVLVARQIEVIVAGVLAVERDLEVLVAELPDRYVFGVKSHGRWPQFCAYQLIL